MSEMESPVATGADVPWHALDVEALYQRSGSGERGLDTDEIDHRIERYGANTLAAGAGPSLASVILHHIHQPLIYLLLAAALVSFVTGHAVDGSVILAVVALNTLIGVAQEWKADKALDALRDMAAPHARVLRGGHVVDVVAERVVPGDILILETGDRVAADARVLEATELRANESALTGESEPVRKAPGVLPEDTPLADRNTMVWMSTAITAGRGRAIVVGTGMDTTIGRIAGAVRDTSREQTPLQAKLARLGAMLGVAGVALAGGVFVIGLLRGYETLEMLLFSVAVAVSAIPEGMPAVISVTLALGVQRMARKRAIIRRLPAVETLGSTTVICSDKTGTITRNEMTAVRLWTLNGAYRITGSGFAPEGEIVREAHTGAGICPEAGMLLRIGALCNNALLTEKDNAWSLQGTPTDGAILVASRKGGVSPEELDVRQPRIDELPFSSEKKYMATLHPDGGGGRLLCVKGGADRVLSFCSHALLNGATVALTDALRARVAEANRLFAGEALRVLAGAIRTFPEGKAVIEAQDAEQHLVFVGLWGLMDPPHPEAIRAIGQAQGAGIRVVMITGDHAETACAVAREVGIQSGEGRVLSGAELDALDDEALREAVGDVNVYARVSPAHKLRILQALKSRREVVAMTGDGVNDAPALKGADIGVAMGKTGTEVAKEAADMILTDDNFATIVHAVEEGRMIFSNLTRVVFFLITTNLGEILTLTLALVIGLPLPLTAVMILWINLVTDGVCTIPLGIEPLHWDALKQPPRKPGSGVVTAGMLRRVALLAPLMALGTLGLFAYALRHGTEAYAMTMAFTTLAAFQWFHAINARTSRVSVLSVGLFSNLWLWGGIGAAVVLQWLAVHTAAGRAVFKIVPLAPVDWLLIVGTASTIFVVDEAAKAIRRRMGRPHHGAQV